MSSQIQNTRPEWTFEVLKETAAKYRTKASFVQTAAYKESRDWLTADQMDEICAHMEATNKTKWTFEALKEVASQFPSRLAFARGNPAAYKAARRNLTDAQRDEIFAHMSTYTKQWTFEALKEKAAKHRTKASFVQTPAYKASRNWLTEEQMNEICSHMEPTNETKWTFEALKELAAQYPTRTKFAADNPAAYKASRRNLTDAQRDEIFGHMSTRPKPWTRDELKAAAAQCSTRREYRERFPKQYGYGVSKGFHEEVTAHMPKNKTHKNTTTKLEIMQDATQYETTLDWSTKSNTNYQIAQRNGWLDEIVEHAGLSTRYWDRKQGWVYFYKIKDTPFWKFGIVSEGRLEQRVNMVASQFHGVSTVWAAYVDNAAEVEAMMRDIGRPVTREEVQPYTTQLNGVRKNEDGGYTRVIDGVTEMRADLTAEDEGKVLTTLLQQSPTGNLNLFMNNEGSLEWQFGDARNLKAA